MTTVPFYLPPVLTMVPGGLPTMVAVSGLVSLDEAGLRIQYSVATHSRGLENGVWRDETGDSGVQERVVPLRDVRSARVAGWGWWRRLVIATSDLRALEGFPGAAMGEVALRIRRRDRTDALELASRLEYAHASRLLAAGEP